MHVTCLHIPRRLLRELAATDPPAFICHFYNVYFAHSAGGRMIGKKVSSMCLDDAELNFYRWDGELSDLLGKVPSTAITMLLSMLCTGHAVQSQCSPFWTFWLVSAGMCHAQVKDELNEVADAWTDEQKAHCLDETTKSFEVRDTWLHSACGF